jgi:stage V sporulation protein D (sporulation-specific penicillin-binding protein)
MTHSPVFRIRIISLFVILFALIFIGNLYLIQIVRSEDYRTKADRQYLKPNQSVFDRGTIFFQTKDSDRIAAATLQSGFTLSINPKLLKNDSEAYEKINAIYPINKEDFLAKASKKTDPYEEIIKRVPTDLGLKIDALDIAGVSLYKDRWRYYPGEKLASQVLGFMSFKGDEFKAQYGLERQYNSILTRNQGAVFANFFVELFSNINKTVLKKEDLEGDIITTIDPVVQGVLENTVSELQSKYKSKLTGGIIMNPKNGEIYAMSGSPSFDPNNFKDVSDVNNFSNPNVENVYEMGSIIKPLTMAAGIDAGVVTKDTTYNDKGSVTLDKKTFYNFDLKARGVVNMQEVLSQSLNTGAAFVAGKLGNEKFKEYMYAYGLNEKTGIDLPNEGKSITNFESKQAIDIATASFGQGPAFTAIQTIRALATLGNGGLLVTPHIVKRVESRIGVARDIKFDDGRRVLKSETSKVITDMLVTVFDKALLGGKIKMEHYSMAAKTGTAQIVGQNGKYLENSYLHSFFGYFPAYDPKYIVFLFTVEPQGVEYASHSLAEPYSEIAKFLINHYEVAPDR